jgi:hypothetical protein
MHLGAVGELHDGASVLMLDGCEARPESEVHAVLAVQARDHGRDLRAQDSGQWECLGLDDRDVAAGLACCGGDLEAYPPGSDDEQAFGESRCEREGVVDGAQVGDVGS